MLRAQASVRRGAVDVLSSPSVQRGALVLALCASLAAAAATAPRTERPGAVRYWTADRDAQAVVGLDDDLLERARCSVRWPVQVEARADGGAWVASAAQGLALGAYRLVRVDSGGVVVRAVDVGAVLDLDAAEGRDAFVLEREPGHEGDDAEDATRAPRLLRVAAEDPLEVLAEVPRAHCVAAAAGRALVGGDDGSLRLLEARPGGAVLAAADAGAQVVDVAPAGGEPAGRWWVLALEGGGIGRLELRAADLSPLWSVSTGLRPLHMIAVPGAERAWIADVTAPCARRYGPGGALELDLQPVPQLGLDRGAADPAGGVVLTSPGALVRLDSDGRLVPGQGGFDFPVDVGRVP